MKEGLGPSQSRYRILCKPHLCDNSSHEFKKFDKRRTINKGLKMQSNVDTYGGSIHIYYTVTYLTYILFRLKSTREKN